MSKDSNVPGLLFEKFVSSVDTSLESYGILGLKIFHKRLKVERNRNQRIVILNTGIKERNPKMIKNWTS